MVSYYVTFVVIDCREFFSEPNSSPHIMSGGFISLQRRYKTWTLDWTMDWTMDWTIDSILDLILD